MYDINDIIVEKIIYDLIQEKFASEIQRKYFWWKANKSKKWHKMAKEFEKETPKNAKLPYKVKKKKTKRKARKNKRKN